MATRIFKNGELYFFQDNDNLDRVNTLNVGETTYNVDASGRHNFKQLRGLQLRPIYSFLFADMLDQKGLAYATPEAFNTELAKPADAPSSDQRIHRLVSAATTNATLIRTGETRLYGAILTNDKASSLYVKYYNKATAPTVGTDIPVITLTVKTKESINLNFGSDGILFNKGLAMAVTGAIPDADTTATGANEMFISSMIDAPDFFYESLLGVTNGITTLVGFLIAKGKLIALDNSVATVSGTLNP